MAEALESSNVSLQCKASGHPRPTIGWRREDGEPIKLRGDHVAADNEPAHVGGSNSSDKTSSIGARQRPSRQKQHTLNGDQKTITRE